MRILNVATSFPFPPDDGTKIQRFERVRELSRRHDVTVLCVTSVPVPADALREMERYCRCVLIEVPPFVPLESKAAKMWALARSIAGGAPYYFTDRLSRKAVEWLEREVDARQFDVVEADADACIYLGATVKALKVAVLHSVPAASARRNLAVASSLLERLNLRIYEALTRRYEARLLYGADLCVALTFESCRELQALYPHAHVRNCLSNGVDLDYFSYDAPRHAPEALSFVGRMDYGPNIDAVLHFHREIFPLVRERVPHLRFSIIGSNPPESVQALGREPGVEVTGYVDDVRPHVRRAGLMVLPLRMGSGILNKLLQGLALGIPVVATPLALEGLKAVRGRDLLVADGPQEFAAAIVRLAGDAALRSRLSSAGRAYVEEHHQWSAMVERYETELERLLRQREPGPPQNPAPSLLPSSSRRAT